MIFKPLLERWLPNWSSAGILPVITKAWLVSWSTIWYIRGLVYTGTGCKGLNMSWLDIHYTTNYMSRWHITINTHIWSTGYEYSVIHIGANIFNLGLGLWLDILIIWVDSSGTFWSSWLRSTSLSRTRVEKHFKKTTCLRTTTRKYLSHDIRTFKIWAKTDQN